MYIYIYCWYIKYWYVYIYIMMGFSTVYRRDSSSPLKKWKRYPNQGLCYTDPKHVTILSLDFARIIQSLSHSPKNAAINVVKPFETNKSTIPQHSSPTLILIIGFIVQKSNVANWKSPVCRRFSQLFAGIFQPPLPEAEDWPTFPVRMFHACKEPIEIFVDQSPQLWPLTNYKWL